VKDVRYGWILLRVFGWLSNHRRLFTAGAFTQLQ
jgi:hypothetical protein